MLHLVESDLCECEKVSISIEGLLNKVSLANLLCTRSLPAYAFLVDRVVYDAPSSESEENRGNTACSSIQTHDSSQCDPPTAQSRGIKGELDCIKWGRIPTRIRGKTW